MTKLVYILAASHSGSTLLAMTLGAHPDICTIGELKANHLDNVDKYLCSCGSRIKECPFYRQLNQRMCEKGIEFDITDAKTDFRNINSGYVRWLMGPLHRGVILEKIRDTALAISPTWQRASKEIQHRNSVLIETLCEITGAKVVVDSSKIGLRLKFLLKNPELDVKVIHLIRDGRAVALTYMNPAEFADADDPNLREGGTGGNRASEKLSIEQSAYQWRRCMEEAENILSQIHSDRKIVVKYEDFCTDTENQLNRIFEFIGVEPSKAVKDFRSVTQHVIGNGMRLNQSSKIELDERWKDILTDKQLEIFERIAGKKNRSYGYT